MALTDIVAYVYKADLYCPDCILPVMVAYGEVASPAAIDMPGPLEQALDYLADCQALDRYDERTFDTDFFPKVVFSDQVRREDEPQNDILTDRCGRCGGEL